MAEKTYVINFKANVQGLDNVMKQFEQVLGMNGVNLTEPMQKQWQKLKTMASSYIEEMNKELAKPQPDIAILDTLDKKLSQITTKANNFSNLLAGLMLPKDLSEKLAALQTKIDKLNQQTIKLNKQRFGNERKLNPNNESGLAATEEKSVRDSVFTEPIEIGDNIITSWEQFIQLTSQLRKEGKLTTDQLKIVDETIQKTNEAIQQRVLKLQQSIEADKKQIDKNKESVALLRQKISTIRAESDTQEQLTGEQQQYLKKIKELNAVLTQLGAQQVNTNEQTQKSISNKQTETTVITNNTKAQEKNTSTLVKATKNLITYGTVYSTFRRLLTITISTIKDMDEALTGMAVVTNMSRNQAWEMVDSIEALANQTGIASTEIANAMTMFYQQGKSTAQVLDLTEAAAKAAAIAGIDLTTSVDLLTNAMNGFQMASSQAMEVSDKFAALAAAAATDYEELAVALSKVAAQANLAGMSMDFTLGMLTAGIEVTREAPETIGTALKTIIARMRELTDYGKTLEDGMDLNRVAAALDEIGVAMTDETGMMRDLEDVITEVGQKWDTLNKNQQANVAVAMAGTRQQSRFIAMMQDFERTQELVNMSANSYGATLAQSSKYMEGLEAATNNLTTAWQGLINSFKQQDLVIGFVNMLTNAVGSLEIFLNDYKMLYVLLGAAALIGIGNLSRKMQEWALQKQLAQLQRQEQIKKNLADIEEIKNGKTKRIQEELSLAIQRARSALNDKINAKQKKAQAEELKNEIKLSKEKSIQQKMEQKGISRAQAEIEAKADFIDEEADAQKQYSEAEKEIQQASAEYSAAKQQQKKLEQELEASINLTQEQRLNILQKQQENTQIWLGQLGMIGSLISGIIGPIMMVIGLVKQVRIQWAAVNAEKKKSIAATKQQTAASVAEAGAETTSTMTSAANNFATYLPIVGAVIAGVILAAVGVTAIVSAITNGQNKAGTLADQATQQLQDMQVELYELNNAANSVSSLADEFEKLSNKIGKSNEELKRMDEIAQQVNDTAGYLVVDTSASPEEQAAQMRAYSSVQKQKAQGTINGMKNTISSSAKQSFADSDFWNSLDQEQFYNILTSGNETRKLYSKEYLDAYAEYMRNYDESFAASVRAIAEEEIAGLDNIDNSELRDAILNASVDQFENIFSVEKGFDFTKFNEVFSPQMLSELDNIYSSNNVGDYATFYANLSEQQQEYLREALPIFEIFKSVSKDTANAFADMGFNMQDVNTIFSNLTDGGENAEKVFGAIVEEVNNMEFQDVNGQLLEGEDELAAKRRETFKQLAEANKQFAEEANRVAMMSDEERNQAAMKGDKIAADYQAALDARNSAQRIAQSKQEAYEEAKADGKASNESDEDYEDRLQGLEQEWTGAQTNLESAEADLDVYTNATENATEKNKELAAELLDTQETSTLVDNLTSLSSSMERLSKVTDVSSLSFEEQYDILKDYPQLIDSMERGYLSASDTIDLFKNKTEKAQQEIENSMESIKTEIDTLYGDYKKINLDGVSFTRLFEDSAIGEELRDKVLGLSTDEMLELVENQLGLTGDAASKMANAIQGYVTNFSTEDYFNKKIENEGWTALLDPSTLETLQELTDSYTKLNDEIEKQDDLLGRFNEGSELYNQTLEDRNTALLKANSLATSKQNDLMEQVYQRFENFVFKDKNGKAISIDDIFNLETGIDSELVDNLDKDSKGIIQQNVKFLEDILNQNQDYADEVWDNWETLFESYTEKLSDGTEALIEQLEARKEAYEKYFDELDAMQEEEEYEQSRDSIIQQLQALSGGQDAASKQKIKELQEELNTLNKEQLDAQTQAQRDALLAEMETEIETQNELLDSIDTYLGQLLEIIANSNRTQEQKDWVYDAIKTMIPGITDEEIHSALGFKEGGYVDYTGIARVHGTPSAPEAFLNARDTANIRSLLDSISVGQIIDTSGFSNIEGASNVIQIDEINIQTNELNTEQDFSNAGRALADEFAQAIQKRGINLNVKR